MRLYRKAPFFILRGHREGRNDPSLNIEDFDGFISVREQLDIADVIHSEFQRGSGKKLWYYFIYLSIYLL